MQCLGFSIGAALSLIIVFSRVGCVQSHHFTVVYFVNGIIHERLVIICLQFFWYQNFGALSNDLLIRK